MLVSSHVYIIQIEKKKKTSKIVDSNQFGREKMKKYFLLKSMKAFVLDIASSF